MKITNREFQKIKHKAQGRNSRWFFLFLMLGAALLGLIMGYTWPLPMSHPWTWQWLLWHIPPGAYFIASVALWEKAQDKAIRFYENVLGPVRILEYDKVD